MKTPTKMLGATGNINADIFNEIEGEDGMKVCRGPFNVNCTTTRNP